MTRGKSPESSLRTLAGVVPTPERPCPFIFCPPASLRPTRVYTSRSETPGLARDVVNLDPDRVLEENIDLLSHVQVELVRVCGGDGGGSNYTVNTETRC